MPRSSRNVGLASDSAQNQRNVNRRVPDQDCTDREGELPTPCSRTHGAPPHVIFTSLLLLPALRPKYLPRRHIFDRPESVFFPGVTDQVSTRMTQ